MVWRYPSVLGQQGNLEVDLNYMYRKPLWPVKLQRPKPFGFRDFEFPVLDIHELAAGKLSALLSRKASRDLYDAHYLLTKTQIDTKKLRLAFVIYISMTKLLPASISTKLIQYNETELQNRLLPVLRQNGLPRNKRDIKVWADKIMQELGEKFVSLLPLNNNEIEFISLIRRFGIIDPSIITTDPLLQEAISYHPAIQWAAKRNKASQPVSPLKKDAL